MAYPNRPPPPPPQTMGSANTVFITEIRFDPSFLKTPQGIVKVMIILFSFIGFICIQSSVFWSNGRGVFFNIVAHLALWSSGATLLMYMFHIVEKYHNFKWFHIELYIALTLAVLYMIASTIVVAFGLASFSAAGFFGYLCMVCCGLEAFLKARALQAGALPQGHRSQAKLPHVVTPPALP